VALERLTEKWVLLQFDFKPLAIIRNRERDLLGLPFNRD
jgi:hypothetical protein